MRSIQDLSRQSRAPVTLSFMAVLIAAYVIDYATSRQFEQWLFFIPADFLKAPWTLLSYVLVGPVFIYFVLQLLWLFGIGRQIERDLGTKKYLAVLATFIVLPALFVWLGSLVVKMQLPMSGIFVLLAALTVIWGTRYPTVEVMFMFVLRVQARWVAWISVGMVFFSAPAPLGFFAAASLGLAWLFAANKLAFAPYQYGYSGSVKKPVYSKHPKEGEDFLFDAKRRELERQEQERLRKLFEGSIRDDKE
jgi:membrane associated rhomboid family serine protease